MNWKSIRLELGSTSEFPAGSVSRVYLLHLPLDDHDVVDCAAFEEAPAKATVRRHWSAEPDERGSVIYAGDRWSMRCDGKDRTLCFDSMPIRLGAQFSVVEPDGTILPFKVASVR